MSKQHEYYVKYNDNQGYGNAILSCDDELTPDDAAEALEAICGSKGTMVDDFREATVVDKVGVWLVGRLH